MDRDPCRPAGSTLVTDRRTIYGALGASLVVHLLVILLTWNAKLVGDFTSSLAQTQPGELELFVVPDAGVPQEPEQPTTYVDLPDRLASETPPERADFLEHGAHKIRKH